MTKHPYHLVDSRHWPICTSIRLFLLFFGFHSHTYLLGLILLLLCFFWWRDVCRESTFQGKHTVKVVRGLRIGVVLFILREVIFFFSFFWAYIHYSLNPQFGWPPRGIEPLDALSVPLLNTILLLSSGATITWRHATLLRGRPQGVLFTIFLGILFTLLQFMEYYTCSFGISDSVFGRIFYLATGFHGIHVVIGTLFIGVGAVRIRRGHFSALRHFGFEARAWYWHFVDVVWLFLFIIVYWWGMYDKARFF